MKKNTPNSQSALANNESIELLRARWKALAAREQVMVLAAATVVVLALIWWVALAPALKTLRNAPEEHAQLDRQLQHMQSLQDEARELQKAPRMQSDDANRALQNSLAQAMGATAQISVVGDRATVTLKRAPAAAFAQWLGQVRNTARAIPVQAKLVRSNAGKSGAAGMPATWDGTLVLSLPPTP